MNSIALDPGSNPVFGGSVSFDVSTDNTGTWVECVAYKVDDPSVMLYESRHANYEGGYGYGQPFSPLSSQRWTSGPAHGIGKLWSVKNGSLFKVLASCEFDIAS